jgi:3-oxoacyl-(acyl-carrier-protein) synthase
LVPSILTQEEKERIGVAVGMGMLDLQDVLDTGKILQERGYSRVSPYFIPRILPNLSAGQISIKYGFQVFNSVSLMEVLYDIALSVCPSLWDIS